MSRDTGTTPVTNVRLDKVKRARVRELRGERATLPEQLAWDLVRNRQLLGLKFRRQQAIAGFIVDLVCLEIALIIEIDGPIHDKQRERDAARTAVLESHGFRVVRVKNDDIYVEHFEKIIRDYAQRRLDEAKK